MKRHHLLLAVTASLISCTGSSYKAKPGNPTSLTVGVKQFTAAGEAGSNPNAKGVRDYEQLALPAMLVKALSSTPGISNAYFVPANSPGVDLLVDGVITKSNGRDLGLQLKVARMDGTTLVNQDIAITHIATDAAGIRAVDDQLFNQAAGIVASARQRFGYDPDDLRALVYADTKLPSTPELVRMGTEAAKVERSQIFAPLTSALKPRIDATSNVYYQWQKESVPFMNAHDLAEAEKANAEADEALGMLFSLAGGMMSGYAAGQGNTLGMLGGLQGVESGAEISAQGTANAAVAQNKINEISAQLAKISGQFSFGAARDMTVRIYNKVITLKGSKEQMTAEFRKIVKDEMDKEIAKSQAEAAAAAQKAAAAKAEGRLP